ncbi:hypothetical protein WR25_00282 [Diploscapter pachys]|uniref:Peptidase S1 domain-containing protein n=1 Tax=Diploscapter pachys TaxID=2018661 RepID=A0A2A2M438_9BILA|nr:hypothetical protein WR25_00282 [Diploscapter pachys]
MNYLGWGQYREGKFYPYNYHEELLPIVPMKNCNNKSAYDGELNEETQLCAGYMTKSAKLAPGVCNGDSGSPLMCFKNGKWEVQGIASKSRACGSATFPGVFTYVKVFVPWIRSHLAVLKRPFTVSQFDEPNDYSKSPFYLKSKLSATKKQSPKKSEPPSYQKYLPKDDSKFDYESSEYAEPEPYPDYESEEEYR